MNTHSKKVFNVLELFLYEVNY